MTLTRDGRLLFLTRFVRLFSYGMLAVVLVFYLTGLGLSEPQTGLLLSLTLAGDTVVSLILTTQADRIGRRRADCRLDSDLCRGLQVLCQGRQGLGRRQWESRC